MFGFSRQPFRTARWSWRRTNRLARAWMRCTTWSGSSTKKKNAFGRLGITHQVLLWELIRMLCMEPKGDSAALFGVLVRMSVEAEAEG